MSYEVIRERAGDGSLYEVVDARGRVVSPYPMARNAAQRLADHRNTDEAIERAEARDD